MHSQSACFIWFRGSSEYVCIFLLISAYICACFFLNFFFLPLLFLSLLGPFLSLYFSRLLLNLSFCFVKWNSCDFRLIRSFIVSNFSWHRWMHSVANIIALYSVLLCGLVFLMFVDLFFLSVFTLRCSLVDFVFLRIFVFLQLNGHRKKCHVCVCFISQNWCKMAKKNKRDAQERREEKQQQQPADK